MTARGQEGGEEEVVYDGHIYFSTVTYRTAVGEVRFSKPLKQDNSLHPPSIFKAHHVMSRLCLWFAYNHEPTTFPYITERWPLKILWVKPYCTSEQKMLTYNYRPGFFLLLTIET